MALVVVEGVEVSKYTGLSPTLYLRRDTLSFAYYPPEPMVKETHELVNALDGERQEIAEKLVPITRCSN